MILDKKDTCIIFGTSPFITSVGADKINAILSKYDSIGINTFGITYPNIKYWIWSDTGLYKHVSPHINNSHRIVVSVDVLRREIKEDAILYNIEYSFEANPTNMSHCLSDNNFLMYKTTAHPAVNFTYLKGYKNIILCGVDLTNNWDHFDGNHKCFRNNIRINRIRENLYMFKDYINIYQLNPESDLDIIKVSIEELINDYIR